MTESRDVIVIGAGHNGLACAAYLAKAGKRVLVLEAAPRVGGAAVTREFSPGFKVSAGAHLLYLMDGRLVRELKLASHGYELARSNLRTVALSEEGPLVLDGPNVRSGSVSAADAAALVEYHRKLQRFGQLLARQHSRTPSRLALRSFRESMNLMSFGLDLRSLGRDDMRELLRLGMMALWDVLEENFESPLLKGTLSLDGVLGAKLGPRSGLSYFNAIHRASAFADGAATGYSIPRGGLGAVSEALAGAAREAGAQIRLSTRVASLVTKGDRVVGVKLEGGEEIAAPVVVSNADPQTTLLGLLGARHLETEFVHRVRHIRATGCAAKLHLALSAVPAFKGVSPADAGERLVVAPDMTYVDDAFNPAKYREMSGAPVLEISVPTLHDASLAPSGQHVLSAIVQYAPYDLEGGWEAGRPLLLERTLEVLERHSPGIRSQILGAELLSPVDLEREFGMRGGHWHHGELAIDQFMMLRPVPGAAQYAMPVGGLYLCGAGAHPGGGVMGSAGRNAARTLLSGASE